MYDNLEPYVHTHTTYTIWSDTYETDLDFITSTQKQPTPDKTVQAPVQYIWMPTQNMFAKNNVLYGVYASKHSWLVQEAISKPMKTYVR